MFANDTALWVTIRGWYYRRDALQEKHIVDFLHSLGPSPNLLKTLAIFFSQRRLHSPPPLVIQAILWCSSFTYLDAILDFRFSFVLHFKHIRWKANVQFLFLSSIFYARALQSFYFSMPTYDCPIYVTSHFKNLSSLYNNFFRILS